MTSKYGARLGGPKWLAWCRLAGAIVMTLGCLSMSMIAVGVAIVWSADEPIPLLATAGGALGGAAMGVTWGLRLFRRIGQVEVHETGEWTLRSPLGGVLTHLPPNLSRSWILWADANPLKGAPRTDFLQGELVVEDGRHWRLIQSDAFDLLCRLGYGNFHLDHPNLGDRERRQASETHAVFVFAGDGRRRALVIPSHTFEPGGRDAAGAFLSGSRHP